MITTVRASSVVAAWFVGGLLFAANPRLPVAELSFARNVQPVMERHCIPCHSKQLASGGLDLTLFATPESIVERRDGWERIVRKLRTGEMPPAGLPRPPAAQVEALAKFVEGRIEIAERTLQPDPGRVTVRRLNRNEYANTVRDLLAVDFHAERDFPTDDSGHGFDNMGDVLTVSPVLMEKYLTAAERIAARAIGADPLPQKPIEAEYHAKHKTIRRVDASAIEATHRLDWDGEYLVRIGLPGQRGPEGKPVNLGFWMNGKLRATSAVDTRPSKLEYFDPYSDVELRLALPAGDHVFRAGFIGDEFPKGLAPEDVYNAKKNKFLNSIVFIGPFPATVEKPSRKKILICDPNTGPACVNRILATLARRAYRRPVTKAELVSLAKFVTMARAEGHSLEQGIQLAIQAILVSPHFLFRIERDPHPGDSSRAHAVSDLELASRLSYFLWSSMPDDELLSIAEAGQLRRSETLEAQVKRMLADDRVAALASNFGGQWLETRNLESLSPDPKRFPEWGPELRESMASETRLFFEAMLREDRPLSEFLDGPFTFLDERLAKHYGIDGVSGSTFRRVQLSTSQRGGVLSHASVLAVTSYPTRTSPVIRGKYLLQNFLGAPPPAPPPDVPTLNEEAVGNDGSLRQQLEKHRRNANCASCHSQMDVLGFGLENYDALGRWRTMDGKFPVDASGTFPNGKSFGTPAEMKALLKEDLPDFARCLVEKMLTYALGRGLERYDRPTVGEIGRRVEASGYRMQTLVHEVVRSRPFLSRRAEAPAVETSRTIKEVARP